MAPEPAAGVPPRAQMQPMRDPLDLQAILGQPDKQALLLLSVSGAHAFGSMLGEGPSAGDRSCSVVAVSC